MAALEDTTHRQHGLCPLSVAALQHLDALQVAVDLHQVADGELAGSRLWASAARARHLVQRARVERPAGEGRAVGLGEAFRVDEKGEAGGVRGEAIRVDEKGEAGGWRGLGVRD